MAKRRKPNRSGKPINVWLHNELFDAFELYCRKNRRTKTAEIEIALEDRLKSVGMWSQAGDKVKAK